MIRKSITFEAAHQLETAFTAGCHECIHGHSYKVEILLTADLLNEDKMVLDFSELKPIKDQIMEGWDHGLILHENKRAHIQPLINAGVLKSSKVTFLNDNPTAETMARIVFTMVRDWLYRAQSRGWDLRGLRVYKVRIHETSTGWAEYSQEGK